MSAQQDSSLNQSSDQSPKSVDGKQRRRSGMGRGRPDSAAKMLRDINLSSRKKRIHIHNLPVENFNAQVIQDCMKSADVVRFLSVTLPKRPQRSTLMLQFKTMQDAENAHRALVEHTPSYAVDNTSLTFKGIGERTGELSNVTGEEENRRKGRPKFKQCLLRITGLPLCCDEEYLYRQFPGARFTSVTIPEWEFPRRFLKPRKEPSEDVAAATGSSPVHSADEADEHAVDAAAGSAVGSEPVSLFRTGYVEFESPEACVEAFETLVEAEIDDASLKPAGGSRGAQRKTVSLPVSGGASEDAAVSVVVTIFPKPAQQQANQQSPKEQTGGGRKKKNNAESRKMKAGGGRVDHLSQHQPQQQQPTLRALQDDVARLAEQLSHMLHNPPPPDWTDAPHDMAFAPKGAGFKPRGRRGGFRGRRGFRGGFRGFSRGYMYRNYPAYD